MSTVYVGLMSGTSIDGVDGVVAEFAEQGRDGSSALVSRLRAHASADFPASLRDELLALNGSGPDELHRAALAANAIARVYAEVVEALIAEAGLERGDVVAIGAHGQTVRHRPGEFDGVGYTTQVNAPALLAELTGIDVVADLRSRDVAAGGHGAPLASSFHRAIFAPEGRAAAVLNLGGIANLTALDAQGGAIGFDCGPANVLLDLWQAEVAGRAYDAGGAFAARGRVDARLLDALLDEPYYVRSPPKSTGRDLFNRAWLEARLAASDARARLGAEDVQATLAELTARTSADAFTRYASEARELVVCGGGAYNVDLMRRLASALPSTTVVDSGTKGVPPDQMEAAAFAWLAYRFTRREAGNLASVTGARGPRVLGALYPARLA